jgi:DnaK suppressor protein
MPSKKANKAAKKPGKAIPKKAAVRKPAVAKKAARASPGHISKVTVKPHKPSPKPTQVKHDSKQDAPGIQARPKSQAGAPAKPASAAPNGPSVAAAERSAPIVKFDSRPLVIPTRTPPADDDGDESSGSASLLAGPRNVKPYIARRGEQYMSK